MSSAALTESLDLLRIAALAAALLLALSLEHFLPHARLAHRAGARRTNFALWLLDALVMRIVCGACGFTLAAWCEARGFGLLHALAAPAWLALPLGVIALDAVSYFWHRANHRVAWLWRFHRVHHADRAFQATTALRFHPGELLLALPLRLAAIAAFGLSPLGVLAFEIVFGAMNLLEHGNFDLPARLERALARGIVTPALHRLHHSRDASDLNSNFGTVLSAWDRALGTLRESSSEEQFETGLPGALGEREMTLARAIAAPFAAGSATRA
ncbi:MAG: sterol desaturase family protein [Deltaproteobacteria bacterium]|nr:sterol desaturase family protein [Deltaproteobacteria bacterium]